MIVPFRSASSPVNLLNAIPFSRGAWTVAAHQHPAQVLAELVSAPRAAAALVLALV
jgi:hypothetical protein